MSQKLQLDIPLILPEIPDVNDACVERLTANLAARPGIEKAHIVPAEGDKPALLCIHYDRETLSLGRIRDIAQAAGAAISERYGHVLWPVKGINHQRKARTVTTRLRTLRGVIEADANATGMVRVEFDREQISEREIFRALARMGAVLSLAPDDPQSANLHELKDLHVARLGIVKERTRLGSGQNMGVMRRVFCLRRSADHRELRPL